MDNETVTWKTYTRGAEGLDAMYSACKEATLSIHCETYIFSNDERGRDFVELFIEKAKAGVEIKLLCDNVGSYDFYSSELPQRLIEAGAEVRFFNIVSPWRIENFSSWYFRDHRKILVIDSQIGFIGSINIKKEIESWRETHLKLTGKIVEAVSASFDQMWKKSRHKIFFRLRKLRQQVKGFAFLTNAPRYRQRRIYYSLISRVRHARDFIYLTTPYFVPDGRFFRAIRLASKRGVDVRLIVPENSDIPFFNYAVHSYFTRALRSGMKIFKYHSSILHTKTVVIDNEWATVGSFNLDNMSFLWNYEANIESTNKNFVAETKNQFLEDLAFSKQIDSETWEKRPLHERIFEYLSKPFHRFL